MASNLFRLKKIKINIEFKGRNFSTDVQPYKTIKYVKEQAKSFFYPIADNISIYYQNKDLTNYESNLIGDYFKKRTTVALRLLPIGNTPHAEVRQKIMNSNTVTDRIHSYICSCNQEEIEYYCRTCKDFICNACRMSLTHSKHNVVQVDTDNFEESAKLYAITLQADVLYNIKSTHDYYIKFQNQNFIEASARQEMFLRKLNKIHSLYKEMIEELSFKGNQMKAIESLLDSFSKQAKSAHVDLETILTMIYQKYTKGRIKMSYEEMKNIYEEINQREKKFEEESCDALAYKVNYEMNTLIDTLYNKLDETVDEMLNSKIPFGLTLNSYYTYEMIKNKHSTDRRNKQEEEKSEKEEVKVVENPKIKETKQIPTGNIHFKNRYVINAKDRDSLEINQENMNTNKVSKEVSQKNIFENKGYDEIVNLSDNTINNQDKNNANNNNVNEEETEKEKKVEIKVKESNEADDLLEMLSKNEINENEDDFKDYIIDNANENMENDK